MHGSSGDDIDRWLAEHPLALLVPTTPDCGVCDAIRPRVAEMAARYTSLLEGM